MRLRNVIAVAVAVTGMGLLASANPVQATITFTGSDHGLGGPTQGVYYYPFVMTVTDSNRTTILKVACDDDHDGICTHNPGESWTATENTFHANGVISGGMFTSGTYEDPNWQTEYQKAAWLFSQLQPVTTQANNNFSGFDFTCWASRVWHGAADYIRAEKHVLDSEAVAS